MSGTAPFDLESIVVRSPELATAEVNGGVLMFSVEAASYFDLNETGGAIWAQLEHPTTVRALRDSLLAKFDASPEQVTEALFAFLSKMSELKLVLSAAGGVAGRHGGQA